MKAMRTWIWRQDNMAQEFWPVLYLKLCCLSTKTGQMTSYGLALVKSWNPRMAWFFPEKPKSCYKHITLKKRRKKKTYNHHALNKKIMRTCTSADWCNWIITPIMESANHLAAVQIMEIKFDSLNYVPLLNALHSWYYILPISNINVKCKYISQKRRVLKFCHSWAPNAHSVLVALVWEIHH